MKPSRFIGLIAASALYLSLSAAQASPLTSRLDDFQPNCDIRKLSLTRDQHAELRVIRDDYKKALDNAMKKANAPTASAAAKSCVFCPTTPLIKKPPAIT